MVKQNTQPRLEPQKCVKVMSHPTEVSHAKTVVSRCKTTHKGINQPQSLSDQPRASLETKIVKPKTASTRERDLFQLPVKNRFSLLSQELQAINNTAAGLNVNAPEYVPIVNRQVKTKGTSI